MYVSASVECLRRVEYQPWLSAIFPLTNSYMTFEVGTRNCLLESNWWHESAVKYLFFCSFPPSLACFRQETDLLQMLVHGTASCKEKGKSACGKNRERERLGTRVELSTCSEEVRAMDGLSGLCQITSYRETVTLQVKLVGFRHQKCVKLRQKMTLERFSGRLRTYFVKLIHAWTLCTAHTVSLPYRAATLWFCIKWKTKVNSCFVAL